MSGLVTGTAMLATVGLITLLAAPAALSVGRSRMSWALMVAVLIVTCLVGGVLGLVAEVLVAAAAQVGSLVTGYAPGLAATSTTSLAEWNALDATRLGIPVAILPIKSGCRVSSFRYYEFSIYIRRRVRDNERLIRQN
ncbi:hypothetical protein L1987_81433 [Smallanthus sonchifolius]|uniref:Uncharacterized protein n=1 Tax=Smallanthus sonchifolius TaxID=185202 RepID=A0ACB8YRK2_9ASTR|nr:hypothetical protein L1987_81433 [Smallanthus sonchifolius]